MTRKSYVAMLSSAVWDVTNGHCYVILGRFCRLPSDVEQSHQLTAKEDRCHSNA